MNLAAIFEHWSSPRYAQLFKIPPSRILKSYVYTIQINRQTFLSTKCLRGYRAGPGLIWSYAHTITHIQPHLLDVLKEVIYWFYLLFDCLNKNVF